MQPFPDHHVGTLVGIMLIIMLLLGGMAAWEVVHWRQSNIFLLIGLGTTVLCVLLLVWWMYMDRNEDVLECPDWLRLLITLTGWGSLVLLLLGTLIQYL